MDPFVGEIKPVGFNFAARGYAMCNGQLLAISANNALFALLGTVYGGNGQTNFGLPNLQGRVPIHHGQGPGTSLYQIGQMAGTEAVTLALPQLPIHNHQATTTVHPSITSITATTTINGISRPSSRQPQPTGGVLTGGVDASGASVNNYAPPAAGTTAALAAEAATTTIAGGAVSASATTTIGNNGGSQPFPIVQPFLAVTYLIALVGVFPSRN